MDRRVRFSRCATLCLLTGLATATAAVIGGCGGSGDPGVSNRLWIDHVPSDKRDGIAALLVGPAGEEGRIFGVYYRGTVFRGELEAFEWIADPEVSDRATIRLLQDDARSELTIERCEPDPKFDHCLLLRGDPQGTERYQSRRRWGTKGAASAPAQVEVIFSQILAEDPDIGALLSGDR